MSREIIHFSILFISLLLIQVLICNHIVLFNVATPIIFIYFIVRLPMNLSTNWVITLSFLLGLLVDIFSDTLGMNALACTTLAMMRRRIFALYNNRDDRFKDITPCISTLGIMTFSKYLITMSLCYCALIFLIEYFSLSHITIMLIKIISSTIWAFIIILGIDSLMAKQS